MITREDVLDDAGGEGLARVITREDVFGDDGGKEDGSMRDDDEEEGEALGGEVLAEICGRYKGLRRNMSHDI